MISNARQRPPHTREDSNSTSSQEEKDLELSSAGASAFLQHNKENVTEADLKSIYEVAAHLDIDQARTILEETLLKNQLDPNYPQELLDRARIALATSVLDPTTARVLIDEIKIEAALIDDSPYLEVRSVVPNTDDPTLVVSTARVWIIGLFFTVLGTGINTFFSPRYPSINFPAAIIQILAYPMARAFDIFPLGSFLNPAPFNHKEHMLIVIMGNTGLSGAYINYIIFVLRMPFWFNEQELGSNLGFQITLAIASQCMGFSLAGLTRRFLVYPPAMIWQSNLAQIALNNSFHGNKPINANGWTISRYKFFVIIFFGYFFWYPISNILFVAIAYFNWPTWIAPNNVNLAVWMGSFSGLGLNPISSFDWSWFTYIVNPTITPLFSTVNAVGGIYFWSLLFIVPVWYTNTWNTSYFPMVANGVYDRFGKSYKVTKILKNGIFDQASYEAYSEAHLSAGHAMGYAFFFAFYTSSIVHGFLYHYDVIKTGFASFKNKTGSSYVYNDVHNRLMRSYKEVPEWWFGIVFVVTVTMAIIHAEVYNTLLPVWSIFFACVMCLLVVLPVGIITAVTNVELTFNVLGELIAGYALPGKPLANMLFKSYSVEVPLQAIQFASDLKLGHYMKIPPRLLFWGQLIPTIISAIVSLGVTNWQITNIEGICTNTQPDRFYCLGNKSFFTASVIWGVIGPKRNYSQGGLYDACTYGFLVGAILPIIPWFLSRRYPRSIWKYVHIPVSLSSVLLFAPYGAGWALPALYLAIFMQYYIRRNYTAWWSAYNYLGTSSLNASLALAGLIWFFVLQYKDFVPDWWGNSVVYAGVDGASGAARLPIPDIGYFGAASGWH